MRLFAPVGRALGVGQEPLTDGANLGARRFIWPQWLAVNASVALVVASLACNAARDGYSWAGLLYYGSLAAMFVPLAARTALPNVARGDRIALIMIAGIGLFLFRAITEPTIFTGFDEYLHWVGTRQLMETQRLFTPNVLFPIGPSYPGLEIVTSAFASLSGATLFLAARIVLLTTRIIFVGALFLVYERLTQSHRIAALGCMLFMGSSTFTIFHSSFLYESLAISLLALCLLLDLRLAESTGRAAGPLALFALAVLSLSMTHHITSFELAALLGISLAVEAIRRGPKDRSLLTMGMAALLAFILPTLWSHLMGDPAAGYLLPRLQAGLEELLRVLANGLHTDRKLFTTNTGDVAPLWQRVVTLGSVAIICLGLALGFFRSLSWAGMFRRRDAAGGGGGILAWSNSRLVALTLLTIAYPLSLAFRLTAAGWEIGNRMAPIAFLGVGVVLAVCAVSLIQGRSDSLIRAISIGAAATIVVVGGIISDAGPSVLPSARYRVSADAASIEPMGISAARWTKDWLGPENRFGADRVNSILLAGFGEQLVATTQSFTLDAGQAIVTKKLGAEQRSILNRINLSYLLVDLRLTTELAFYEGYFDGSVADQLLDGRPPEPEALLKFSSMPKVSRIFDNGYEIIYDIRALSGDR